MRTVRVAAASDLRFAFEELRGVFPAAHPGIVIEPTYGSSGSFAAQITNGAPFDLFLSADRVYIDRLIAAGRAMAADSFAYARGSLVLWLPNTSPLDLAKGLEVLADPRIKRVAVANPTHAPYGRAAVEALRLARLHDVVKPKFVLGENVAQAAQFLETGAADAGLIARSLALAPALQIAGRYFELAAEDYTPLEQVGVVLSAASDRDAALMVKELIVGPAGQAVLREHGFAPPGG